MVSVKRNSRNDFLDTYHRSNQIIDTRGGKAEKRPVVRPVPIETTRSCEVGKAHFNVPCAIRQSHLRLDAGVNCVTLEFERIKGKFPVGMHTYVIDMPDGGFQTAKGNKGKKEWRYTETKVRIAYCLIQYSTFCQRSTHPLFMHLFLSCQSLSGRNVQLYSGCYRFLPPSKCTLSARTRKEIYEPSGGSSKSECYLLALRSRVNCASGYADCESWTALFQAAIALGIQTSVSYACLPEE
ncbi:hypothetical protein V1477_010103 [Vespula maculifrons]|uniref:Uncharacterized protein n=1 Tax=Vespula maculifrons TaxID=7453 RepID=A0ABD2CBZ3_VESMC